MAGIPKILNLISQIGYQSTTVLYYYQLRQFCTRGYLETFKEIIKHRIGILLLRLLIGDIIAVTIGISIIAKTAFLDTIENNIQFRECFFLVDRFNEGQQHF